ncbi:hypothetical protein MYEC719_p30017 (plasmid) [Escherichia coli]|nr:hypothetical protein MYEC719_p30017 [Escherichia coli]
MINYLQPQIKRLKITFCSTKFHHAMVKVFDPYQLELYILVA